MKDLCNILKNKILKLELSRCSYVSIINIFLSLAYIYSTPQQHFHPHYVSCQFFQIKPFKSLINSIGALKKKKKNIYFKLSLNHSSRGRRFRVRARVTVKYLVMQDYYLSVSLTLRRRVLTFRRKFK